MEKNQAARKENKSYYL